MKTVLDLYREYCAGSEVKQKGALQEWAGPCPECGGNDRFVMQPYNPKGLGGRWLCRGCDRYGDAVSFLREFCGRNFFQACEEVGVTPGVSGIQSWGKARQEGKAGYVRVHAEPVRTRRVWVPGAATLPSAEWMKQAAIFAGHCVRAAVETAGGRAALAARGLTVETAIRLGIGWNAADRYEPRHRWGLPVEINPETGRPRMVWLPRGLVVPFMRRTGIAGLFVRRMPWSPEDKGPKCCQVKGGTNGAYCAGPADLPVVVVESILDACLIRQEAGDLVSVVALTGAAKRPDRDTDAFLRTAPVLLWALDRDNEGGKQWAWWQEHYQITPCRVPGAKDPGEYLLAGGSLRRWIELGLYYAGAAPVSILAYGSTPDCQHTGTGDRH